MSAQDLRAALLAPTAAFRQTEMTLAGQPAIVREPSAGDWTYSREKAREWLGLTADADPKAIAEAAKNDQSGGMDAALLVRVLFNPAGDRVFQDSDADALRAQWGPQYARVVWRAIQLAGLESPTPVADAKNASPETQAASS